MKYHFCPVCAYDGAAEHVKECSFCHHALIETEKDVEYYVEKAKTVYTPSEIDKAIGFLDIWYRGKGMKIAFEEEYKCNPLFDESIYKARLKKKREDRDEFVKSQSSPSYSTPSSANLPTCPICHSTNLKKISAIKAAAHWCAFGLLSKTARSQWECKNCGTKF